MDMKVDYQKIRALRLEKSWSQEQLAEKASVSLRTIQRMELDGSASLKTRSAVAEALGVEPVALDPHPARQTEESGIEQESVDSTTGGKGFWPSFLSYPGSKNISRKIRTPLLVTLWIGMMITGGISLLMIVSVTIFSVLNSGESYGQYLIATIPNLVIFAICLGLYAFFKRFTSQSSN